jgi:hypothetical protein
MSRLHDEIARLETALAQQTAEQPTDYVQLAEQGKKLDELRSELTGLEDRWLELSELNSG